MSPRKLRLSYKKERSLLSDVLPYEIPVSFSNRHFYSFILRHRIQKNGDTEVIWLKSSAALDRIIHLLFCLPDNPHRLSDVKRWVGEQELDFRRYQLDDRKIPSTNRHPKPKDFLTPFRYKINHKETEFRELCVPHPRSQLHVSEFYDRCKETILYYTSLSPFSIRAPSKVAKFTFHNDKLHKEKLSLEATRIETLGNEYESLRSFFVYREYSNIYKFYESYRYHRCEKKYNNLTKLDVSKCFDSIYTHSIGWATIGKDAQKEALGESNGSFPDRFDRLMQRMNMGETNGIIIGPEFSRIFAEIILQAIDREVEHTLRNSGSRLEHQVDYEVFRYVDDYFVFYNRDEDRVRIVDELQHALRRYKLSLNAAKAVVYEKPIITEITMAKQQIAQLLEKRINFNLDEIVDENGEVLETKGSVFVNSNALITSFKTIIKTCEVEYKDMLNYTLSIVERKSQGLVDDYMKVSPDNRSPRQMVNAITSVIEFVFFIYAVSPRVNTTIRLCRILEVFNAFFRRRELDRTQEQIVHKLVYDNTCFIIKKNKSSEHIQVETLYLLIALSALGRDYWLEQGVLADYLGIELPSHGSKQSLNNSLSYFSITVSLFYMRDKVRYNVLREHVVDTAIKRIRDRSETCHKDAELVLLLFDLISCPYIPTVKKAEALKVFGVSDPALASDIIGYSDDASKSQRWFTNWLEFDFAKELDAKRSQEVY
ncbi:antiviral reverse transcriptase Drt3b [Roseobacter sp. MH60115]|uniref:antiviral reverse transcriptase Drt3b n=1 Tax=Roseobacter sp. MH60115 TaxID=2785324 RepID=UPI0018A2887B|nr:antiviral reverse transcriptase Drt3b [Roseobacter sp. MH60115]